MINKSNFLRNILSSYSPISDNSFDALWSQTTIKQYKKGDFLLHVGRIAKKMLFVHRGILISSYNVSEGNRHIKNFFIEGKPAASTVSLICQVPSEFALQAIEDAEVFEINYSKYRQLMMTKEDLKNFYIAYLEKNWVIANEQRQLSFATKTAHQRYLTFLLEYPHLEERVAQKDIASYIGITPTQLSRIRKKSAHNSTMTFTSK